MAKKTVAKKKITPKQTALQQQIDGAAGVIVKLADTVRKLDTDTAIAFNEVKQRLWKLERARSIDESEKVLRKLRT